MTRFVTEAFEQSFRERLQVADAIAVNSGTSALLAALYAIDLQPGDEVITTPFTFIATTNAIVLAGGRPIFADIDQETLLIDPDHVERHVTNHTRAILPVHLFGRVCEMDRLCGLSERHHLFLIEDAAQALGAVRGGRYAGTFGDCGCFSFYKTKNLSTFEGGMLAVPAGSRIDGRKLRAITNQGDIGNKDFEFLGCNFRMPEPCALIGLELLKLHWPGVLAELGRFGPRDGYYPRLVYQQPVYQRLQISGECPVAERIARQIAEQGGPRT